MPGAGVAPAPRHRKLAHPCALRPTRLTAHPPATARPLTPACRSCYSISFADVKALGPTRVIVRA